MSGETNNLVLGKGKVYFDRFADNTKTPTGQFRYLGNTPGFSLSQTEETLDHFDSDEGLKQKDESVTLSNDTSGTLSTDNISDENLALWWLGTSETTAVASATAVADTLTAVKLGSYFQLGASEAFPQGVGTITNVVVHADTLSGSTIAGPGNWEVDLETGMFQVLPGADEIADGDTLVITHDQTAVTFQQVIARGKTIYGALKFIATNPVGKKRDGFFPYCKLAPDGDFSLKGEDWQTLGFKLEVLKLNSSTERVYWTYRA